jgi:hypothetical protein
MSDEIDSSPLSSLEDEATDVRAGGRASTELRGMHRIDDRRGRVITGVGGAEAVVAEPDVLAVADAVRAARTDRLAPLPREYDTFGRALKDDACECDVPAGSIEAKLGPPRPPPNMDWMR